MMGPWKNHETFFIDARSPTFFDSYAISRRNQASRAGMRCFRAVILQPTFSYIRWTRILPW